MKNIPKELRGKIRRYSLMVAWWQIHAGDEEKQDKLVKVLERIGDTEDELRVSGVDTEMFDKILKSAKKFVTKTVGEMTDSELETMMKLIFGQKTEMLPFNRKELNKPGIIYLDPIKYAERERKRRQSKV